MKSIGFEILLDDSKLKAATAVLKKELSGIGGAAKDIRVGLNKADMVKLRKELRDSLAVKVNIGITDGKLKNLKAAGMSLNSGIVQAAQNMDTFLVKLREAEKLSKKVGRNMGGVGGGGVGGGGVSNGGSRTGFGDATSGRSLLSAFSGFIRGGQSYTSQVGALASGLGRLGLAYGLPIAAAASFVRGLGQAISQIKEFGARNAELAAVLATSRTGISELTEQAVELGSTMAFTASEIAGAQIELAKLGFSQGDILSATEDVARFAIIIGAKIPEAAEAAGAAMLSFGLDASDMERVISVLGVGAAKSALDFEKLKVGIGTTFATAKTFGLEIEDVVSLLGELSNKGLSGSVAATATRNILLNLSNAGGKLRKTLDGLGVKEVKGLEGIISALRTLNNAGIDLNSTFEITDKRSVNAFNTFLRGAGQVEKLRDSLIDVGDEAKIMERERLNSLSGATILYQSAVERLNLTLGGSAGMEGIMQSVVLGAADLLNALSDLIALEPGEALRRQGKGVVALLKSLQSGNISLALRKDLIAELNLSYPDLIDGFDLEKASLEDIQKLIEKVNAEYEKKINTAVSSSAFQESLKKEEEILKRQRDLIVEINGGLEKKNLTFFERVGDFFKNFEERILGFNITKTIIPDDKINNQEFINQRKQTFGAINQELEKGNIDLDQLNFLNKVRGKGNLTPNSDAAVAQSYINRVERIKSAVLAEYGLGVKFDDKDFRAKGGDLSKVDQYLNRIGDASKNETGLRQKVLLDEKKRIEKQIEDRRKPGNVDIIGKPGGGSGKDAALEGSIAALEGSIDELEAIYNELYKRIESTAIESDRYVQQKKAEEAKKTLDAARELVKANAALTAEEELKLFKNGIDNKVTAYNEYAKAIINDEETLNEVIKVNRLKGDLEILQREEADLQKLNDKKLGKTNELARKQIEIELKKKEILDGTDRVSIETREALAEEELRKNVENAEKIIKNEEDRSTYIELLYLKLSKFKLENEKKIGKELTNEQVKQLADLEKQIQDRILILGGGGPNLTPQNANDGGRGAATSKINNSFIDSAISLGNGILGKELTEEDYSKYQDSLKKLELKRNIEVAEDKLKRTISGSDAEKEAEYELHQLKIENQRYLHEKKQSDADKEKAKIIEIIRQGSDIIGQISGQLIDYERSQQEARAESELETIDAVYEAKLKAAEGNAAETERLEKEYQTTKKAAEKKAAEERRQIALKEARINLALGIIKAIPNFLLMAVAAASGLIQIAAIQRQKFKKGGFTPKGNGQVDETGSVPVGIVHDNEYVAPKHQIRKYPGLFNFLDNDRKKFATGGFTGASVSGGFGVQISEQNMYMLAEIMSQRVSQGVYEASLKGTSHGSTEGSKQGIIKANREISSREASIKVNTF